MTTTNGTKAAAATKPAPTPEETARKLENARRANRMKGVLTLIELHARQAREAMTLAERAHAVAAMPKVVTPQEIQALAQGNAAADPKIVAANLDHQAQTQLGALGGVCVELAEMLGFLKQDPDAQDAKPALKLAD